MTGGGIGDNDAASNGGGLYVAAGTATLTNGEVNGNDADNGGGLYLATGAATLIGSTVSGNEVRAIPGGGDGGGLYVAGGELTLTGSTVSDNTAQYGGGLYLAGGEATLTNCTVNDNNADISGGGGLYIDSGIEATLTGTTVSGNSAQGGGGIGNDGLLTLTNSTVSGNTAVFTGGIDNGGTLTLTHSTVSGNSALAHGGGLGVSGGGATTLRGSIVAGNTGGDCHTLSSGTYTSNGYNVVGSGGGCPSGGTGDLADSGGISSLLGILFDNGGPTKTHGLPILSPARDRIPAAQCGAASGVDQRGVARPQGPGCDSGAVELPYHTLIIGPPPFLTEYPEGTVVALTPLPDTGQTFVGWTVDGVAKGWAGTLTITMDDDHTVEGAYVATKTFADVGPGRVDYAAIVELASRGTILGFNATTYGPDQGVQRAQMAALIARAMPEGPGTPTFGYVAPPACAVAGTWDCEDWGNSFTDQGQHYQVAFGYTAADCQARGRAFPCYGPTDPVSHAQTIAFITRAMIVKGYWVAQPNAPLPYAGVPGVLATEVRTFHYYTGGVPDAPGSASGWNGGATRGWFARALWAALDSYWGVDGDLPDQRPAGGYVP
jgi:hypothetical protein